MAIAPTAPELYRLRKSRRRPRTRSRSPGFRARLRATRFAKRHRGVQRWRMFPPPARPDRSGNWRRIAAPKDDLGALVTLEMGKILAEGKGEVQEMIDIADFAVGLVAPALRAHHRRASARASHVRKWQPLGWSGVISAFNFPVAVWSWNAFLAAVCGDCVIWKPSLKTPLTAIAVQKICDRVLERHGWRAFSTLIIGDDAVVGKRPMLEDHRIPLDQRHRLHAHGPHRCGDRGAETRAARCSSWAATTASS
jgi:aldehyde dehydrogenase (NAD+)